MAGLFQVLRGQADGTFKKAEALEGTDGEPLIIPVEKENWVDNICTRPFAVDWDGDEHLDLVVGNFTGTFFLFKGEGKGKFLPEPQQIKVDDQPLTIKGHHSDPFVIDWDGDGDLDLLSGSSEGGLQIAENHAGAGKSPELVAFKSLIEPRQQSASDETLRDEDLTGPSSSTRIWIDDMNSDGKLDVFVGDLVTLVAPAGGLTEKEFKAKYDEWQVTFAKVVKEMNSPSGDEKTQIEARQRFQKLYSQRSEFMKEDRTGFVWLYLQK